MPFIYIAEDCNLPDAKQLLTYYECNILAIAHILKKSDNDVPRDIALYLKEGDRT